MKQVRLILKDQFTGDIIERSISELSEFYTGSEDYRHACITTWIQQRGNAQHNTLLSLVEYQIA